MSLTGKQLQSTILKSGDLQLSVETVEFPEPKGHEILVEVQAAPVNPSDMFTLFSYLDPRTATTNDNSDKACAIVPNSGPIGPDQQARMGSIFVGGNEGAGRVIAAGDSELAQSLIGKLVGIVGGEMYAQYRVIDARSCFVFGDGVTPERASSPYVNPITALSMVETMAMEGHSAIVHNAAASNLGQMLNRICIADGIGLVNIVRRQEQVELLKSQGAKHVINASDDHFREQLFSAIAETGASIAFDPVFGGDHVSAFIEAMQAADSGSGEYAGYAGQGGRKQVYIYGLLKTKELTLNPGLTFNWGISGYLVSDFMAQASPEKIAQMKDRVIQEINTTFASEYAGKFTLEEACNPDNIKLYTQRATGKKYLLMPSG